MFVAILLVSIERWKKVKIIIDHDYKNLPHPDYAHPLDAGMDLIATSAKYKEGYYEYGTGIHLEIPPYHFGMVCARSSVSNKGLMLCNGIGIIDSTYRGEIKLRFYPITEYAKPYKVTDKIGQLIILPYEKITLVAGTLSETNRGSGGFGSTDGR